MTQTEFDAYLSYAAYLALGISLLNLALYKRRGPSALYLSGACAAAAAEITIYRTKSPTWMLGVVGIIFVVLALADVVLKSAKGTIQK